MEYVLDKECPSLPPETRDKITPQKTCRGTMFFGKIIYEKIVLWSNKFGRHLAEASKIGFLWGRASQSLYWLCALRLAVTTGSGAGPHQILPAHHVLLLLPALSQLLEMREHSPWGTAEKSLKAQCKMVNYTPRR